MVLQEMSHKWRSTLLRLRGALTGSAVVAAPVVMSQILMPNLNNKNNNNNLVFADSTNNKPSFFTPLPPAHSNPLVLPSTLVVSHATYPANDPFEDRHDVKELGERVVLAAVMDGHGGWQAAEFARHSLLETVARELEHSPYRTESSGSSSSSSKNNSAAAPPVVDVTSAPPAEVASALTRAFTRVDRAFLSQIRPAFALGFGDVAHVGCCALAAAILPRAIVVANAGDCRAVLGRTSVGKPPVGAKAEGTGAWQMSTVTTGLYYAALALSNDHNAREPAEKARLAAEHPNEPDVVLCKPDNPNACYVKGRLQPTRVLGDAYLKDSEFNAPSGFGRQYGRHIRPPYTPPYVSSTPEVSITTLEPTGQDASSFLIMGCDGVWDVLSNEEAVSFVAHAVHKAGGPSRATTKDLESIAERLKEYVLIRAADAEGMTIEQLRSLRPGKQSNSRRDYHDDITAVIVFVGPGYKAKPTGNGANSSTGGYGQQSSSASGSGAETKSWKLW